MAFRWFAAGLVCAVAAWALRAEASDKPSYGPPPAWVEVAPTPQAHPADDAPALEPLLDDNQSRLGGPGGDVYYNRRVVKVLKPEGLSGLTSQSFTWSPDIEDLAINSIAIWRDGKVIDLLQGGKDMLVLRRETGLEQAMLDGRLTATRQIEGLQVGDVLDVAWTETHHDPVMNGRSQDPEGLSYAGVTERFRVRISWPDTEPVRWRVAEGLSQPEVVTHGGRTELLLDESRIKRPAPPAGAPGRFFWVGRLDASSFKNWEEVSGLISPLFEKASTLGPSSPLKAEAAAIAARSPDPKVRAFEALKLVEDKTRYLYLGMNDGGFVPAAADETWRRRFGDCKGKTVLLLSLLKELGIEAEPALVSTTFGDGLDQALPGLNRFDHVIVRASIGGAVYWLDGTRTGDIGGVDALLPPAWRWALPLRRDGAPLERIVQTPLQQPLMAVIVRLDASKGLDTPASAQIQVKVHGDAAIVMRRAVAVANKDDLIRMAKQRIAGGMGWIEPKTVTWQDDLKSNTFEIDIAGVADMDWRENTDVHAREFRFPGSAAQATFPRRDSGPEQDAPFAVAFPFYILAQTEVDLPNGGKGFSVHGLNLTETIANMEIKSSVSLDGAVARFTSSTRSLASETPASDAEAARKQIRLLADEPQFIRQDIRPTAVAMSTLH